jgi:hypothetical protein
MREILSGRAYEIRPPCRHIAITQKVAHAARETGVVHEYVDSAELGLDRVECSLTRRLVCHFKRQREYFDIRVRILDVGFGLFQGLDLSGGDDNPFGTGKGKCI